MTLVELRDRLLKLTPEGWSLTVSAEIRDYRTGNPSTVVEWRASVHRDPGDPARYQHKCVAAEVPQALVELFKHKLLPALKGKTPLPQAGEEELCCLSSVEQARHHPRQIGEPHGRGATP